jgi:molybdopterin biosynthesis enzyme
VDAGLRDAPAVAASLEAARAARMGLVLTAGGVATDPADMLVEGLRLAGGSVEQMGLPVDPGTACWIGRLGSLTVIGLASCELTARPGAVDLLLARVFAGIRLSRTVVQSLAHGGIVDPRLSRFPPYPAPSTIDEPQLGGPG